MLELATFMKEFHVQLEALGTETGTISQRRWGRKGQMPRVGTAHLVLPGPKEVSAIPGSWCDQNSS
jgi:hypothetical protein